MVYILALMYFIKYISDKIIYNLYLMTKYKNNLYR